MIPPERIALEADQLVGRFPREAALIARLLGQDDAFRAMCEDWILAKNALARQLERTQSEQDLARIAEYRRLVSELEDEIVGAMAHACQSP